MIDSTELAVAEQPRQLMTIEPVEYVAQVFEPFAKRLADAKTLAQAAEFDVTTTAGMAVAVKHRATFRDIRVASEKARKERKAPILEIGKLLDSRQKEIEAEIEPFETRFDSAIKAEEQRKEVEKAAKLAADKARADGIRAKIERIKDYVVFAMGRTSEKISAEIAELESTEITLEEFADLAGEAQAALVATVSKLKEMLVAQQAHEAEQARLAAEREALELQRAEEAARLAAERAELDRLRAEQEERERVAAAARAEQEAKDRAERERVETEQRAAQERAAAAMRAEQQAHEQRMREQQAEIDRQQAEIAAAKAERERAEQARQEAERRKREAEEAAQKIEADHAEALTDNAAIDAARAAAFEAQQQEAQRRADEQERIRREQVQFIINGPGDVEIVKVIAEHYDVALGDAMEWMKKFDYAAADEYFAAANVTANRMEQAA